MGSLKTTWRHMRRSPYQVFAAILIMMLTFLFVSIFTFVIFGLDRVINYFESKPQVTAFFKDEAKKENIDALKDQIQKTGKVSNIRYVSKNEALKIYQEQNKNDPLLLELVTADILPASLEISTIKINDLSSISDILKESSFVKEVIFQKDVVSTLTLWTNALRKAGIILVSLLSLVSFFIIVTIIGIRISQRREEIEIMRLIGATSWYVRFPFMLEGMFYGFIGALLGWIVASSSLLYILPSLTTFLRGIPINEFLLVFLLELLGIEVLAAIILGAFSSSLAVLRYLK